MPPSASRAAAAPPQYAWGGFLNVMGVVRGSFANGPTDTGRYVLWVQGCPLACVGCFNPQSWASRRVDLRSPEALAEDVLASGLDGLTVSGGEPLLQAEPLGRLLAAVEGALAKGVILFSGLNEHELDGPQAACLDRVDLAVLGRFERHLRVAEGLRGSSNQVLRFSEAPGRGKARLGEAPLTMDQHVEAFGGPDGSVLVTGFPGGSGAELARLGLRTVEETARPL